MFKVNSKKPERRQRRSGIFTVNYEISHFVLVFLLLNLNK